MIKYKDIKDEVLFKRISSLGDLEYRWIPVFDSNDDYQLAKRIHVLSSLCMGKHFTPDTVDPDTVDRDLLSEIFEDIQMCSNVLMNNMLYREKKYL